MSAEQQRSQAAVAAFWRRMQRAAGDACWLWTGSRRIGANRYGLVRVGDRQVAAHRVAWLLSRGPIPAGMYVCQRCRNRLCVRPDHLYLAAPADRARERTRAS